MMSIEAIPEEWVECSIADIAAVNPQTLGEENSVAGFIPMSHAPMTFFGELTIDEKPWDSIKKSYTNFRDGDVIFAKVTPCFENGKAALVRGLPNGIGAGSSEFYVLRPLSESVLASTLFAVIKGQRFMQEGAENMTGAVGLRRVPRAFVESFPVALPSVAEQKAIAEKLDTLLAQVENTKARLERIPKILKRFRQSVLAAAVSGKLTDDRDDAGRVEIVEKYFAPEGWDSFLVGEMAELITSGSRGWSKYYSDSGSIFIRSQDINTDELDISRPCFVSLPGKVEGGRTRVKKNDLLITITGANVTRSARIKSDMDDAYVSQHVALVRLKDEALAPFVEMALKAINAGRNQLQKSAYGGGKPGLNLQNIKDVRLAIPTPDLMNETVRRVDQLFACADTVETQVNNALERVNLLTQSILAKAFRGELTEQWRKDNPVLISGENSAEALLQKIKAQREAEKPVGKARGNSKGKSKGKLKA